MTDVGAVVLFAEGFPNGLQVGVFGFDICLFEGLFEGIEEGLTVFVAPIGVQKLEGSQNGLSSAVFEASKGFFYFQFGNACRANLKIKLEWAVNYNTLVTKLVISEDF